MYRWFTVVCRWFTVVYIWFTIVYRWFTVVYRWYTDDLHMVYCSILYLVYMYILWERETLGVSVKMGKSAIVVKTRLFGAQNYCHPSCGFSLLIAAPL